MSAPSRLTVLAGPTAVGKGTVAAYVREHHPEVWVSVSATTRRPRPGDARPHEAICRITAKIEWLVDARVPVEGMPMGDP